MTHKHLLSTIIVEIAICFSLVALSVCHFIFPAYQFALKQLYFAPIIVSALFLGWRQASAFTVAGVCLVLCLEDTFRHQLTGIQVIELVVWASILGITSALIGFVSSVNQKNIDELVAKEHQLALTDPLTNIANRRAFEDEIERQIATCQRKKRDLAILVIDIDHFKKFNDSHGHEFGDKVLAEVATAIKGLLRISDFVARYGGEEFVVVLPETKAQLASEVAERVRSTVASLTFTTQQRECHVTVSIGVATCARTDDRKSLFRRADLAMYAAKSQGRNCVVAKGLKPKVDGIGQTSDAPAIDLFDQCHPYIEIFDSVSGLVRHQIFEFEIHRRIYEASRYETQLSIGLIKLNFLRSPNSKELKAGIKTVADLAKSSLRESDLLSWHRFDEIVIMMPNTSGYESQLLFDRLDSKLRAEWEWGFLFEIRRATASVGVGDGLDDMLHELREKTKYVDKYQLLMANH